jgi:hypothetical protein
MTPHSEAIWKIADSTRGRREGLDVANLIRQSKKAGIPVGVREILFIMQRLGRRDGEQVAVPNAWVIMGRGSGGTSFVHADAEMLFRQMLLGSKPEEVALVDASGEMIQGAGESAGLRRFTDHTGLFGYRDRNGNQAAISGSLRTLRIGRTPLPSSRQQLEQ